MCRPPGRQDSRTIGRLDDGPSLVGGKVLATAPFERWDQLCGVGPNVRTQAATGLSGSAGQDDLCTARRPPKHRFAEIHHHEAFPRTGAGSGVCSVRAVMLTQSNRKVKVPLTCHLPVRQGSTTAAFCPPAFSTRMILRLPDRKVSDQHCNGGFEEHYGQHLVIM